MAKTGTFNVAGAVYGPRHMTQAYLTTDGRSLHPLQRSGMIPHSGFPSVGATGPAGLGSAPPAAGPSLSLPPILNPSAVRNTRIS